MPSFTTFGGSRSSSKRNASISTSSEPGHDGARWRSHAAVAAKTVVSVVLLAVLFARIDARAFSAGLRQGSVAWLSVALGIYIVSVVASVWRWHLLLKAQGVHVRRAWLLGSFLVALFFNNFLPSSIGGDIIRIRDTAQATSSKTLAATIVVVDRAMGLMGLVLFAAVSATVVSHSRTAETPVRPSWYWIVFLVGAAAFVGAVVAPAGVRRLLRPLAIFHVEWVHARIETIVAILSRFRVYPAPLVACFAGAVFVQGATVLFLFVVGHALHLGVTFWDLLVIVPVASVVQMLPVSLNGFGVREATFALYFANIGLPIESALLMSLVAATIAMVFSMTGAVAWYARKGHWHVAA